MMKVTGQNIETTTYLTIDPPVEVEFERGGGKGLVEKVIVVVTDHYTSATLTARKVKKDGTLYAETTRINEYYPVLRNDAYGRLKTEAVAAVRAHEGRSR